MNMRRSAHLRVGIPGPGWAIDVMQLWQTKLGDRRLVIIIKDYMDGKKD